jgi:hypothetical protein
MMLEAVLMSDSEPIECDLVGVMKTQFLTQIGEVSRKLKVTRRSIERAERMRGRFRRNKPGDNTIERVLEWEIDVLKRSARTSEAALKQRERAIALLNDYVFAQDISKAGFKISRVDYADCAPIPRVSRHSRWATSIGSILPAFHHFFSSPRRWRSR